MMNTTSKRECVHTRQINLNGYRREDGMIDIEGEITDVKAYAFPNRERGTIEAGEPIHHMQVRITINDDLEITDAEAKTVAGPYRMCPSATLVFDRLVGLKIGPGWSQRVRKTIGGIEGCTHITELMGPVATVAYQTLYGEKARQKRKTGISQDSEDDFKNLTNSCIGHAEDAEAVLAGVLPKS
jgi:hypothetical protein